MTRSKWCVLVMLSGQVMHLSAAETKTEIQQNTQDFMVKLGASRVIYDPDSKGATLTVFNQQDYPMLVKSSVMAEDKNTPAPFIVEPPLFRLDGQQQSRLRIVRTGGEFARDRETLQWICVTGIPPQIDDEWAADDEQHAEPARQATLNVQFSVHNCIKLMLRPSTIKADETEPSRITWTKAGKNIRASNPTPFYMNLYSVSLGQTPLKDLTYIPPFSSRVFGLPEAASGRMTWTVVTELGTESPPFHAALQ